MSQALEKLMDSAKRPSVKITKFGTMINAQIHQKFALFTTFILRKKLNAIRLSVFRKSISAMMESNVCRNNVVKMQNQPPMEGLANARTFKSS